MKFTNWQNVNYDHLDRTGKYLHGHGVIPSGTTVQFVADGDRGTVIHGNSERSLVSYKPDPATGCSEARDWFDNSELRVPVLS